MKSRYVILISGLSKYTRSRDIREECERFGTVMEVERDTREREALVEFKHSSDAADAYDELDGFRLDDRTWKVHRATEADFRFFGWKWFEDDDDERYERKEERSRRGSSHETATPRNATPDHYKDSARASPVREMTH